jgi:hypothetical protein
MCLEAVHFDRRTFHVGSHSVIPLTTYSESVATIHASAWLLNGTSAIILRPDMAAQSLARWLVRGMMLSNSLVMGFESWLFSLLP